MSRPSMAIARMGTRRLTCSRQPAAQSGKVLALASERHYLRVYTERGEALILYRLKDAIRDLAAR